MNIFNIFRPSNFINSTVTQNCPNCWGYSEWANKSTKAKLKLAQGSLRETGSRNGFIRKFMEKHVG